MKRTGRLASTALALALLMTMAVSVQAFIRDDSTSVSLDRTLDQNEIPIVLNPQPSDGELTEVTVKPEHVIENWHKDALGLFLDVETQELPNGCLKHIVSSQDGDITETTLFTEEEMTVILADPRLATIKHCSANITDVAAGNWCTYNECKSHKNTLYTAICTNGSCPLKPKWDWLATNCSPGGQKYITGCKIKLGNPSACK